MGWVTSNFNEVDYVETIVVDKHDNDNYDGDDSDEVNDDCNSDSNEKHGEKHAEQNHRFFQVFLKHIAYSRRPFIETY